MYTVTAQFLTSYLMNQEPKSFIKLFADCFISKENTNLETVVMTHFKWKKKIYKIFSVIKNTIQVHS